MSRSSTDARTTPEDPSADRPAGHILVGEIASAHALRGEVSVKVLSEDHRRFDPGSRLLLGRDAAAATPVIVENTRWHSSRALVKLAGVDDRSAAEQLRGHLLFVAPEQLRQLGQDEFWEHELAGADVYDVNGTKLGTLAGVQARPEQDIWSVETSSGPVLLPAAKGIVVSVDIPSGRVVVDPPAGLFSTEDPEAGSVMPDES